jgi:transposase
VHVLISKIEVITVGDHHRRWSAVKKLRIVGEAMYQGESISSVARCDGIAPNLLFC